MKLLAYPLLTDKNIHINIVASFIVVAERRENETRVRVRRHLA